MKQVVLALCALILTVVAAADIEAAYIVGDTIADFTLNDAYGTPVSLYGFDGMVIWLVFWSDG
jgi:cytochrome oxidase Cu insertion factor (SCO1/SenC/PrrC family)